MLSLDKKSFIGPLQRRVLGALLTVVAMLCLPSIGHAGAHDDFFQSVKIDDADAIKSLLRRGLDPNLTEAERGDTGLILALREESMKVFEALLNARDIDLESKARNGDTALMIAAYKGNKPAVEALLQKGAEVNRPGWTALHYAAAIGRNDIVSLLLDNSAYIDAEAPNKTTPIMMAARSGHILTVKLLLDEGADVTLKTTDGLTAIDFARLHGYTDIVEGLTHRLKKSGKL